MRPRRKGKERPAYLKWRPGQGGQVWDGAPGASAQMHPQASSSLTRSPLPLGTAGNGT
jgi:hypothetical protein